MWKHSDWNKKTKVIVTSLFLVGILVGKTNKSSDSTSSSSVNDSGMNDSSMYGTYSDFSGWSSNISGKVVVREDSWMYYINDNNNVTTTEGITKGTELYDEYGRNKVGYIDSGKVYIYYVNSFYPVGK